MLERHSRNSPAAWRYIYLCISLARYPRRWRCAQTPGTAAVVAAAAAASSPASARSSRWLPMSIVLLIHRVLYTARVSSKLVLKCSRSLTLCCIPTLLIPSFFFSFFRQRHVRTAFAPLGYAEVSLVMLYAACTDSVTPVLTEVLTDAPAF